MTRLSTIPESILITGNLGYVGPGVVATLRAAYPEARLVGLDTGYFAHCLTGVSALPERHLDGQILADVRQLPEGVLANVDTIVHLAAISNDPIGNLYESVTAEINHIASVELAERAREAGVNRFVFASSCSVYGATGDDARTEESELAPLTAYARSKVETERELEALADETFSPTCLRFATACGMSDRLRLDLVLNDFVASAVSTGTIELLSDGSAWRPLIHVSDMARAIVWAAAREPSDPQPYLCVNVGSGEWNVRIRALAEAVGAELPGVTVTYTEGAVPDKRSYRVDFSAFAALVPDSLRPQVQIGEAVSDLRAGLERMSFDDARFREGALMRLHTLNALRERHLLDKDLRWLDRATHLVA